MEISIPPVLEDFSTGDRMYFASPIKFNKGTVTSLEGDGIHVTMDNNQDIFLPMSSLAHQDYKGEYWGRLPNLELIEAGTVLSRFSPNGNRHYATVRSNIPGVKIIIEDQQRPGGVREFKATDGFDLEKVFRDFEIEA